MPAATRAAADARVLRRVLAVSSVLLQLIGSSFADITTADWRSRVVLLAGAVRPTASLSLRRRHYSGCRLKLSTDSRDRRGAVLLWLRCRGPQDPLRATYRRARPRFTLVAAPWGYASRERSHPLFPLFTAFSAHGIHTEPLRLVRFIPADLARLCGAVRDPRSVANGAR